MRESIEAIRPAVPPMGAWPALDATARSQIGRFNNPTTENVRALFADALGLHDVTASWNWRGVDLARARTRLVDALTLRHQIAHGVNPRPVVQNNYARRLPGFFRLLGRRTANPWPQ